MDDGTFKKHVFMFSTIPLALSYCYFISSRIPVGFPRLISLLPVIYLFTTFPLHFPSVLFTCVSTFFLTWLANFKLVLYSFGRGPLPSCESFKTFMASATLPVPLNPSKNSKKLPISDNIVPKILISALLLGIFLRYKQSLNHWFLIAGYCLYIHLMLDFLVALSNVLVRALVNLELEPPSDKPYLSTSLREFWGKRWNLPAANLMRETVYKPVRTAMAAVLGNEVAPVPAVFASFLVSGLMHELLFYYAIRVKPSWEITSFFVLNGVCVVLEVGIKEKLRRRWGELPRFVSAFVTVWFVVTTCTWLFFPPFIAHGFDVLIIEENRSFVKIIFSYCNIFWNHVRPSYILKLV